MGCHTVYNTVDIFVLASQYLSHLLFQIEQRIAVGGFCPCPLVGHITGRRDCLRKISKTEKPGIESDTSCLIGRHANHTVNEAVECVKGNKLWYGFVTPQFLFETGL